MKSQTAAATHRRQRGLTLIESLMVLAIGAVTLGAALPGLEQMRQRRHFDGAAAQLETDLQFARSMAVAQNRNLRVSFQADAGGASCYVVHAGPAGSCVCNADGNASCADPGQAALRSVRFAADELRLSSNVPSMVFDATKGTVSPTGTLRLVGRDERAVHLVVNLLGRVRSCSPGGQVAGYKAC